MSDAFKPFGDDAKKVEKKEDPRQGLPPTVEVVESTPENPLAPLPLQQDHVNADGPWIQYNGIGTLRYMDQAAWKDAGIESDKYVEWNGLNKMRVPRSEFNDNELQYLLRVDGRFSLVDE